MNEKDILPGISEGLRFLKEKGVRIGLGSASKNAVLILEKLNLISFFEVVIDGNQVSKSKPDPEVFLKGSNALNVIPSECIVFEDATAGIEAAKKAGMTAIAFGNPSEFVAADFPSDPGVKFKSDEEIYSQYIDYQFRPYENIYATVGGRNDIHTTAGDEQSFRVTGAYDLGENSKIRSSYGTGFFLRQNRCPSLGNALLETQVQFLCQRCLVDSFLNHNSSSRSGNKHHHISTSTKLSIIKINCDNCISTLSMSFTLQFLHYSFTRIPHGIFDCG